MLTLKHQMEIFPYRLTVMHLHIIISIPRAQAVFMQPLSGMGFPRDLRKRWGRAGPDLGGWTSAFGHRTCLDDPKGWWVVAEFTGDCPFTVVSIYAGGSVTERTNLCKEISSLPGPLILVGDFNMVESSIDRLKGKGQVLSGAEKREWDKCLDSHSLDALGSSHGKTTGMVNAI